MSFVHKEGRVDVPAGAVRRIKAYATQTFVIRGTGRRVKFDIPEVEICLSEDIGAKLRLLTERIVDQPIDIVVDCEVVSSPVIREPMNGSPCILIKVFDAAEANALADKLRGGLKGCHAPDA